MVGRGAGELFMLMGWGRAASARLPLSRQPVQGKDGAVRKWVLLDELGFWSWTSQKYLVLHPRD